MLSSTLALHDVADTEALCARVIQTSKLPTLTWAERDDLQAHLVATCWEISTRYEPGRGLSFSTVAYSTLKLRAVDWIRKERGRTRWTFSGGNTYERARPTFVSFDDSASRLDTTLAARGGDPAEGCDPDLERILADGDRTRAGDHATLGLPPARRAG